MRSRKLKALAAGFIAAGVLLLSVGIAGAWSGDTALSGSAVCNKTVTWKVTLSSSGANPATPPVVQTSNRAVVPVGTTLKQGQTFNEVVSSFPVTLTITVKYPASNDKSSYSASATVNAPSGCVTTTTTKATTTTTKKVTTTTHATTTTTCRPATTTTTRGTTTTTHQSTTTTSTVGSTTTTGHTDTTKQGTTTTTQASTTSSTNGGNSTTTVSGPPANLVRTGSNTGPLIFLGLTLMVIGGILIGIRRRYL